MKRLCVLLGSGLAVVVGGSSAHAQSARPYRLGAVDLKQQIIWGDESLAPSGEGLAFGGQDQNAEDGRPHTRIRVGGTWQAIGAELRQGNPLQAFRDQVWHLRTAAKEQRARLRYLFFQGRPAAPETRAVLVEIERAQVALGERLDRVATSLVGVRTTGYARGQAVVARGYLVEAGELLARASKGLRVARLRELQVVQVQLELAAEALDAEPAPRAIRCGERRGEQGSAKGRGLVYDPESKLYVLFGGDHLDYLTNDTWVFDPARRQWFQRRPEGAPPPRANHRLESLAGGKVRLTGGYTYASNTDYVGGQYRDLDDGPWIYDLAKNEWSGGKLVAPDSRTYRTGPFHPDFYLQGDPPDADAFDARLEALPANEWVTTDPPFKPRLNRDWGTAVLDPDRDIMLRWSGGHSAHGGTDVPHFHFATNRWELAFPVEFPLGQLYSNTSYPNGFNFNRRPWMTGHTYQNYHYDPVSKLMVKAGRPRHHYLYDPERGDWIGRGRKPEAMCYNSCFYTLTLVSTPGGIHCWDRNGRVHRFDRDGAAGDGEWIELELAGEKLPGAVVDNSTIAYDAKRDRILMVTKSYGRAPFSGQVWALDLKGRTVSALSPAGMEHAHRFAYLDRCVYHPDSDLVIFASYLNGAAKAVTPTPAYDCAANRWVTLNLNYATGRRGERVTRAFPHGRSNGIMFDPRRRLIWGADTNSQIYVLRLEAARAGIQSLGARP